MMNWLSKAHWVVVAVLFLALDVRAQTDLIRPARPQNGPATRPAGKSVAAPLTHYMGREIAQTMHYLGAPWLVRESRDREEEPRKLLGALDVKPGQLVCDLGCGNGFYTLPLAEKVGPNGVVFAVEIQQEMLDMLAKRAAAARVRNIYPVLSTTDDPMLPPGKLDLVLLVDVYHELSNPPEMLAAIKKGLAPGGRLVLVEFRAEDPNVPIKPLHKMSKAQILKELNANGFKLVKQFDELPWQHVMFFE